MDRIANYCYIGALFVIAVNMMFCLLRAVLGPRFTDRLVAINMIGTKTVLAIAVLTIIMREDYLADICLVYAAVSFLTVVVLTQLIPKKKTNKKT